MPLASAVPATGTWIPALLTATSDAGELFEFGLWQQLA